MRPWPACLLLILLSLPAAARPPRGWELYTTSPKLYMASRDTSQAAQGKGCGLLRGENAGSARYALLLQRLSARQYRGHRVRLSGQVATHGLSGWAGLWIRVDGPDGETLAFDNMEDRPIRDDQAWTPVRLEIDVPAGAAEIHYGLLLCGSGEARVDSLSLTSVDLARPAAAAVSRVRSLPSSPVNGDFEH
jgi:hypothetical protein